MKTQRIVLPVSSTPDVAGVNCFVIELTSVDARALLAKIKTMKALLRDHAQALEGLYRLMFWDSRGDYYDGDENDDGVHVPSGDPHPTECALLLVTPEDVSWRAYEKHGDALLTTERLSVADLRAIATGKAPR